MKNRSLQSYLCFVLLILVSGCGNYGLLEKLENPGGFRGSGGCTTCRIFISQTTYSASALGGIAAADAKCAIDANKPTGSGVYKALLVAGTVRRACSSFNCTVGGAGENIDWVLKPNTQYFQKNGVTQIAATNPAGIWPAPVSLNAPVDASSAIQTWTGIVMTAGQEWTTISPSPCSDWTSDGGNVGTIGESNATADSLVFSSTQTCNFAKNLYCVEQ